MPKKKTLQIPFSLGGLNRSISVQKQEPYETADCLNVFPHDAITGRKRGGSRPGLLRSHDTQLPGKVRMLTSMQLYLGNNFTYTGDLSDSDAWYRFTKWIEEFEGDTWNNVWSQASWSSNSINRVSDFAQIDDTVDSGAMVRDSLPVDTNKPYSVGIFVVPWDASFHGKYRIFARMNKDSSDVYNDGIVAELDMTDANGNYSGNLTVYVGGTATTYNFSSIDFDKSIAGWFKVYIDGDTVKCYWRGNEVLNQTIASHLYARVGFGLECTNEDGVCLVDIFRVQYYATGESTEEGIGNLSGSAYNRRHDILIASSEGNLYREQFEDELKEITSSVNLNDKLQLEATQLGMELYIADYSDVRAIGADGSLNSAGDQLSSDSNISDWTTLGIDTNTDVVVISDPQDGTKAGTHKISSVSTDYITLATSATDGTSGSCSYRIERAPKVFDPISETISILSATSGQVPTGNPLICRFRGRLVVAGADIAPHVWYMSRANDPQDWDYSKTDAQRAVAGTLSEAGIPGEPINALIPWRDDYLIFGCQDSLWKMRGDPAAGGRLDVLSTNIGIISPRAWCLGPEGELYFLSRDGMYVVSPAGNSPPTQISREKMPRELLQINPAYYHIEMAYDEVGQGVHLYISAKERSIPSDPETTAMHWWVDVADFTFWPMSHYIAYEPFSCYPYYAFSRNDYSVILGGRDGYLRRFNFQANTDDGLSFASHVFIGPLMLGESIWNGVLMELLAVVGEASGKLDWQVYVGASAEEILRRKKSISNGQWLAGVNNVVRPGGRGHNWGLMLRGVDTAWTFESIQAVTHIAGRRRS